MTRAAAAFEALMLAGLGGFMVWLAFSADYWLLLNPKFRWLTGLAGALLAAAGLAAMALAAKRRAGGARAALFALLLAACLISQPVVLATPGVDAASVLDEPARSKPTQASRVAWNGQEYIRINVAELFMLAQNAKADPTARRYVFRAQVVSDPEMDKGGVLLAGRLMVWCCLADAVVVAFLVDHGGPAPALGDWVEAHGRLTPAQATAHADVEAKLKAGPMLAIERKYLFRAEHLRPCPAPSVPYIFTVHQAEPYAY